MTSRGEGRGGEGGIPCLVSLCAVSRSNALCCVGFVQCRVLGGLFRCAQSFFLDYWLVQALPHVGKMSILIGYETSFLLCLVAWLPSLGC